MNKKALLGILIALVIPVIIFLIVNALPKANIPKPVFVDSVSSVIKNGKRIDDTVWHHISDFTMTNQLGQKVKLSDVSLSDSGKIVVLDFFFTRCPTICPGMTKNMKLLQSHLKNNVKVGDTTADYIQFISISVDPERDSVPALKKWADRFEIDPGNWWLLTGDKKQIYDLSIKDLKLMIVDGENVDSNFNHSPLFMLLDKHGVVRARRDRFGNPVFYNGTSDSSIQNLAEDIVLLSLEKDKNKKSFLGGQLHIIAVAFLSAFFGVGLLMYFLKRNKTKY